MTGTGDRREIPRPTHWEDFAPGRAWQLPGFAVDRSEADAFAAKWSGGTGDPALYLTSRLMRCLTDGYLNDAAGLGALGVDRVWYGDAAAIDVALAGSRLIVDMVCEEVQPLGTRSDVGLAVVRYDARNVDNDAIVIGWLARQIFRRRQPVVPDTGSQGEAKARKRNPDRPGLEPIGTWQCDPEDVISFASAFDPQPFHLSEEGGRASLFGGLCASGWHTTSAWLRTYREQRDDVRPIARLENIVWRRPAMAGSTLQLLATDTTDSNVIHGVATNEDGALIFSVSVYLGSDA